MAAQQNTAAAILEVAARNVGFVEGPRSNENPYAPLVGHANFQPWCASFVAACAKRAGVRLPSTSAYTPTMANGFKAEKRWGVTPRVGAIIFFRWPSMGRIAHVGIVEKVNADGSVVTIEGNTNAQGSRTGGKVVRQVRRGSTIEGYGYPVYAAPAKPPVKAAPKPAPAPVKKPNPYAVPVLTSARPAIFASARKTAAEVKYVQWAVGAKDDGTWGSVTTAAVKTFQKARGLLDDGRVGPKTLAALKTVRR